MLPGCLPGIGQVVCLFGIIYYMDGKGKVLQKKSEIFCILSEAGAGVRVSGVVADGCSVCC